MCKIRYINWLIIRLALLGNVYRYLLEKKRFANYMQLFGSKLDFS